MLFLGDFLDLKVRTIISYRHTSIIANAETQDTSNLCSLKFCQTSGYQQQILRDSM